MTCTPSLRIDKGVRKNRISIAATCHVWRKVAETTPSIWSYILLEYCCPKRGETRPVYLFPIPELLSLEFERTGSLPLKLVIQTSDTSRPHEAWNNILSLVRPHISRCESIHLYNRGGGGKWAESIMALHQRALSFPHLKKLRWISVSHTSRPLVDLSEAPNLETVTLGNVIPFKLNGPGPVSAVDELPDGHVSFGVPGCAHNLKSLDWQFGNVYAVSSRFLPNVAFHFPRLTALAFGDWMMSGFFGDEGYQRILHLIKAPQVKYLQVSSLPLQPYQNQFPALASLRVKTYYWVNNVPESNQMIQALQSLENLKRLILPLQQPIPTDYLNVLASRRSDSDKFEHLPLLEVLAFGLISKIENTKFLGSLLEARNSFPAEALGQAFTVSIYDQHLSLLDIQERYPKLVTLFDKENNLLTKVIDKEYVFW